MINKLVFVVLIFGAFASLGWFLFGWSAGEHKGFGMLTYHRWFGRVTQIDLDSNYDGQIDTIATFPWSEGFEGAGVRRPCGREGHSIKEDRNSDGRWDTWLKAGGEDESGNCLTEFSVDTDLDGEPDWVFSEPYMRAYNAYEAIKERRGF